MSKSFTIEQILDWKKRNGMSRYNASWKVAALRDEWEKIESDSSFNDFVLIRIATIIEVFVRETVREVIDRSQEYLRRAQPIVKDVKFDFSFIMHLHGRQVTIGDIVAHSLSVNKLEKVISIYEAFFPGYRMALPSVHTRWIEDREQGVTTSPIIEDVDRVLASVSRIFEIRHIVTHELPDASPYSREEIPELLKASEDFLHATEWFLTGQLHGDVPRTQAMMNQIAGEEVDSEMKKLDELLAPHLEDERLRISQEAWVRYADAEADRYSLRAEGGSMEPLLWASRKTELMQARIRDLRSEYRGDN